MSSPHENPSSPEEKEILSDPALVEIPDWVDRARRARSLFNEPNFGLLVVSATLLGPIKEAMGEDPNVEEIVGFISTNNLRDYPLIGAEFKATAEFLNFYIEERSQVVEDPTKVNETSVENVDLKSRVVKAITSLKIFQKDSQKDVSTQQIPIPDTGIVYQIVITKDGTSHTEGSIKAKIAQGRGVVLRRVNLEDLSPESRTGMSFLKNPKHAPNDSVEK